MADGRSKRRHVRLSAMGPVDVVVHGRAPRQGYLASIGRGGLGLYFTEEVLPMQLALVNLQLLAGPDAAQEDPEELKVAVRVRWVRPASGLWMAGVAFEQMSDQRYERLLRHMNLIESWQLGPGPADPAEGRSRFSVRE